MSDTGGHLTLLVAQNLIHCKCILQTTKTLAATNTNVCLCYLHNVWNTQFGQTCTTVNCAAKTSLIEILLSHSSQNSNIHSKYCNNLTLFFIFFIRLAKFLSWIDGNTEKWSMKHSIVKTSCIQLLISMLTCVPSVNQWYFRTLYCISSNFLEDWGSLIQYQWSK